MGRREQFTTCAPVCLLERKFLNTNNASNNALSCVLVFWVFLFVCLFWKLSRLCCLSIVFFSCFLFSELPAATMQSHIWHQFAFKVLGECNSSFIYQEALRTNLCAATPLNFFLAITTDEIPEACRSWFSAVSGRLLECKPSLKELLFD